MDVAQHADKSQELSSSFSSLPARRNGVIRVAAQFLHLQFPRHWATVVDAVARPLAAKDAPDKSTRLSRLALCGASGRRTGQEHSPKLINRPNIRGLSDCSCNSPATTERLGVTAMPPHRLPYQDPIYLARPETMFPAIDRS